MFWIILPMSPQRLTKQLRIMFHDETFECKCEMTWSSPRNGMGTAMFIIGMGQWATHGGTTVFNSIMEGGKRD